MPNLNTRILEFVNNAVGYYHPLDIVFLVATSSITLAFVAALVGFYFGIYVPWKEKGEERMKKKHDAVFIFGSVFATYVVVAIVKALIAYPRPFNTLTDLHVLINLPNDYSFPSGHAALTMALATAVYFFRKRLGALLFAFAFVVGIARIYVGVHYPLDVGVGFLLGYGIPKLLGHFFIKKETLKLQ
ncbi:MAG: phosphatase PAP2 family protein [Candidatus Paceibacterota bacterium]